METDQQTTSSPPVIKQNVFLSVTPFSKYLAMFLFVAMPFVGGWVGYSYAPDKPIEVVVRQEEGYSENINFSVYSYQPEYDYKISFINESELFDATGFKWNAEYPFTTLESFLLDRATSEDSTHSKIACSTTAQSCENFILSGSTYYYKYTEDSFSDDLSYLNNFGLIEKNLVIFLESQGFMFSYGDSRVFWETYQKRVGDKVQVVHIEGRGVGLTSPVAGINPISEGTEFRVFISDVFLLPN